MHNRFQSALLALRQLFKVAVAPHRTRGLRNLRINLGLNRHHLLPHDRLALPRPKPMFFGHPCRLNRGQSGLKRRPVFGPKRRNLRLQGLPARSQSRQSRHVTVFQHGRNAEQRLEFFALAHLMPQSRAPVCASFPQSE